MQNKFIFDHRLAGTDKYFDLPFTYNDSDVQDLNLPILPPPKRFLLEGSKFHTSPDTVYNMYQSVRNRRPGNENVVSTESNKVRIYDDKLQLVRALFFFRRDKNMMSEDKSGFRMLTYSIKNKALYSITTSKNSKKRYVKSLNRVSLNKFHLQTMHYENSQLERWINALYNAVKKDVPDVRDECCGSNSRIISLVIQHRAGKGIVGLDDDLINNLGHITSTTFIVKTKLDNYISDEAISPKEIWSIINKHKRDTIYKFLPTLKKTGSVNKALKVLLGDYYSSTIIKLIHKFNIDSLTSGNEDKFISGYNSLVPTTTKHMLTKYIRNNDNTKIETLISQLTDLITSIKLGEAPDHVVANWVKTIDRLDHVINWTTWKDMYRMAETLRVRIRPSRFMNEEDVQRIHDGFSRLLQVNNNSLTVPKHKLNFIEVNAPDTYKGYTVKQLTSQTDLSKETDIMGHCVHTYGNKCIVGNSVIFSLQSEHNNERWTVEYSGDNFRYIHGEGANHRAPSVDLKEEILIPLGKEIGMKEASKPLTYRMRSGFHAKYLHMLYTINTIEEIENNFTELELGRQIELINCNLERLAEINKLIKSDNPPPNRTLIELASKIDVNQADDFLIQSNAQAHPAPVCVGENEIIDEMGAFPF